MLSENDIAQAKQRTNYKSEPKDILHENDDCIRMAYQWLDAQKITARPTRTTRPLKHIIEKWAGRYISTSDVQVAAELHPDIRGDYPHFNIGKQLTLPSDSRLKGIAEARSQASSYSLTERSISETYADRE
jgi:hypothetical protein